MANEVEWGVKEEGCSNCVKLEAQLVEVLAEVRDLKARLNLDSQTSHQPPSQDKPWKPKSEREKSGRSSGGHPDEVVKLPLSGACGCGQVWSAVAVDDLLARQVHDLPEIRLQVTEYQVKVNVYPCCGMRAQAAFPEHVLGQAQYGPRLLGLAVYLNSVHFLSTRQVGSVASEGPGRGGPDKTWRAQGST